MFLDEFIDSLSQEKQKLLDRDDSSIQEARIHQTKARACLRNGDLIESWWHSETANEMIFEGRREVATRKTFRELFRSALGGEVGNSIARG